MLAFKKHSNGDNLDESLIGGDNTQNLSRSNSQESLIGGHNNKRKATTTPSRKTIPAADRDDDSDDCDSFDSDASSFNSDVSSPNLLELSQSEISEDADDIKPVGEETRKQKFIKWLKRFGYLIIGLFALLQGIGAGVNKAAAVLKALPSVATVSLVTAQVAITILGILGTIMNFYIMMKELPTAVKNLYDFFTNLKKHWQKSKSKCLLTGVAIFASLCAGVAVGIFTFYSAPMTIIGMMSLFGATVFPPLAGIAIVLAIIQGVALSALLFNSAQLLIFNFSTKAVKNLFTFKWWPRAGKIKHTDDCHDERQDYLNNNNNDDTHYNCNCLSYRRAVVIGKIVAVVLGGALLIAAAIFGTIVEGDAFMQLLKDVPHALATALTVGIIYVSTGILQAIININSANSVFGMFGKKLGAGCYHILNAIAHPVKAWTSAKVKLAQFWKDTKAEAKASPGRFAWKVTKTILYFALGVFIIAAIIGNATGEAAMGSHGVPGDNSHNQMAAKITTALQPDNPQPQRIIDYLTTAQGASMNEAQMAATAGVGLQSAAVISYVIVTHNSKEEGTEMKELGKGKKHQRDDSDENSADNDNDDQQSEHTSDSGNDGSDNDNDDNGNKIVVRNYGSVGTFRDRQAAPIGGTSKQNEEGASLLGGYISD